MIFNGTGINYSWHFPRLFDLSPKELEAHDSAIFLSGASTSFLVYWAVHLGLATWTTDDFCDWSKHSRKAYGANLISGLSRLARLRLGSKRPIFSAEQYKKAWNQGVKPEFFDIKMKDLPKNIQIPLINRTSGKVEVATADSHFAETQAYLVSFAATAIPGVYPEIHILGSVYGDVTYSKPFLFWLKNLEKESAGFVNYNLLKDKDYPNGKYVKISNHPNPKKMMQADNLRFILGRPIPSFAENVRGSKLPVVLQR